jgi:glyoxylate utilization-related uncharacterized protein
MSHCCFIISKALRLAENCTVLTMCAPLIIFVYAFVQYIFPFDKHAASDARVLAGTYVRLQLNFPFLQPVCK